MIDTPDIDYAALSPIIALTAGLVVVLMAGLVGPRGNRWLSSILTLAVLGTTAGLLIWRLSEPDADLVSGALRIDGLTITISLMTLFAAAFAVLLQLRDRAAEEAGHAESHVLLLGSVLGMVMLAGAQNLITFFIALELLSIPLYVLCGSHRTRPGSLESGLKYLIVGSLGSATLLYGMAFIYGGSGSTDFTLIAEGIGGDLAGDPLVLMGIALCAVGLAFKVSVAPFHQWTPDVYEGAPTPITAFMAVATKAAAFAVFARFFIIALGPAAADWQPALAALAAISIIVGNVGALGQSSLKRLLGYSGIAQGGYILVGLLVATEEGVNAMVFYLAAYTLMNLAAFTVIAIRERETPYGDDIAAVEGLAKERPLLAWPLTISMLALAGLPGTVGFMGKLYLIEAAVGGDYTWLGSDDRDRLDDLPRLLPAGHRGRLDATGPEALTGDRRRLARCRRGRASGPALRPGAGRRTERRPLRPRARRDADRDRGDDRLRDRPLAARRLRGARRRVARRDHHLVGARRLSG